MALKLKITAEEFGKLDESIQGLYEDKDGEYILSVDGIEDNSGLKSALEKERKRARELEKTAKAYEGVGMTPEEIAELVKAREEAEKASLEKKGEWEKLKSQMLEKHQKDLESRDGEVKKMKQTLESYLVDAAATEAIASAKGIPQLLLPHVKSAVKVVEEDGAYKVRVMGQDGPRVNANGEFLSIKDLVAEMRESEIFSRAFEGSGVSGSGASPAVTRPSGASHRITRADARDASKYQAAKAAAQKAGVDLQIVPE